MVSEVQAVNLVLRNHTPANASQGVAGRKKSVQEDQRRALTLDAGCQFHA